MTQASNEDKSPEFILIDERDGQARYTHFASDSTRTPIISLHEEEKRSKEGESPISLRLLCLIGLVFSLIFGLGILMWSIVITSLSLITLFQNPTLNRSVLSFWKICFHTIVTIFGFTFGLISPTLGLGLIVLYFALKDKFDHHLLRKIFQRSFKKT